MARRNIALIEIIEALYQYQLQHDGIKAISRKSGLARNTVRKIIREAQSYGLRPGLSIVELEEVVIKLDQKK